MPRALFSDRFQSIVKWSENNIYLWANSPIPGLIRLHNWQKPILESYMDPDVRQVSLMTSSQIGKSVIILCIIGYHIGCSPQTIFFVHPGINSLNRFMEEKFEPMLEASPKLDNKIHRTQVGTIPRDEIPYDGGNIFMGWAGSPASLRQLGTPLSIADEVDVYKGNIDTANPLSIIWKRTQGYGKRAKMIVASTPITSGTSLIEQEFNDGSQGYFYVPCPHCSLFHYLDWNNIREGILYCPGCGAEINEDERLDAVTSPEAYWHEENPNLTHKSYHINQLYSTTTSLKDTVAEYKPDNPRGFWTQTLGLPYRSLVDNAITPENVLDLYQDEWNMGDGPLTLGDADAVTAAVDVQKNRLELQFVLWKKRFPRIDKQVRIPVIEGREDEAWAQLHELLVPYNPDRIFIDRHYPSPDEVNRWATHHLSYWISTGRMWLIVGVDKSFNKPFVFKWPTPKNPYYASLSVDTGKVWVHSLARNKGMSINGAKDSSTGRYLYIPEDFHQQLSSEELRWTVTQSGQEKQTWIKIRRLNETFDMAVYNACARESLGEEFSRHKAMTFEDIQSLLE